MSLIDSSFCDVHFFFWNHCWVWLKIWSIVPNILHLPLVNSIVSKEETSNSTCQEPIEPKGSSSVLGRIQIDKIMHKSLIGNYWSSSLEASHSPSNPNSNRPSKNSSYHKVNKPGILVLSLDVFLVFPGDSFGAGSILPESVGNPGVTEEIIF